MDSRQCKYVIVGEDQAIIFDSRFNHSDFGFMNVTSAGFVEIYSENGNVKVICYGKSVSLKMESKGDADAKIISRMLTKPDW